MSHSTLFGIPKLPQRALTVLIPFFLSCIMSAVVSFISLVNSGGLSSALPSVWWPTWLLSWSIAFPTVLVVLPVARRLALSLVRSA